MICAVAKIYRACRALLIAQTYERFNEEEYAKSIRRTYAQKITKFSSLIHFTYIYPGDEYV